MVLGVLERLGGVLEAFWSVWGASWAVLVRLGRVLKRQKSPKGERGPGYGPYGAAGGSQYQRRKDTLRHENHQTSTEPFAMNADMQLARSTGPVRIQRAAELRTRHRACAPTRLLINVDLLRS